VLGNRCSEQRNSIPTEINARVTEPAALTASASAPRRAIRCTPAGSAASGYE